MENKYEIYYLLAALVTILVGFFTITKKGKKSFRSIIRFFTRFKPNVPKETLRIIPIDSRHFWSDAKVHDLPMIAIHRRFYATNILDIPVNICKVYLKTFNVTGDYIVRHPKENIYGNYVLLPNNTTEVVTDFYVSPKYFKNKKEKKVTIDFYDQYNNCHRIKNVSILPPREAKKTNEDKIELEPISLIESEVEKNVVAVLQSEIHRYKQCGRRVGGLGSIQTVCNGRSMTGVGSEIRETDSPKLQSIVSDEKNVEIKSDNADNLLRYYNSIDELKKEEFIKCLLDRLDKNKPYSDIGYFIFYILFKIDKIELALMNAKDRLLGSSRFGFSDFLRIIDGLLKYQPSKFSNRYLEDIDKFLIGIEEHTFNIKERIAVIRTINMNKG